MFGYVIANQELLSEEELKRYKAAYCGLCRTLKQRHGQLGRLTLNYDMVFLVLVLSALYEPQATVGEERCAAHPCKKHCWHSSEITDYAADMNVALAYLNQLDNWRDDKNVLSLIFAKLLKKKYLRIKVRWPRQCEAMERCIASLSELEKSGVHDPDAGVRCFGELMGEVFAPREDRWAPCLRPMAYSLGGFIYLSDAVEDLPRDLKRGRYNPLTGLHRAGRELPYFKEILTMLIGNCTMEFEKLPLVEDVSLMRSILYSGVWTRIALAEAKEAKQKGEKPQ